ncbi:MAG: hypothetical protein HY553_19590 [Elusimicrobia bacterium]|nr:hypothetical protein [Elusimicrobiota bacterium]
MLIPFLFLSLFTHPAAADSALDAVKRFLDHGGGTVPAVGRTVELPREAVRAGAKVRIESRIFADRETGAVARAVELWLDARDITRAESILGRSDGALGYRFFTTAGIFSATTDAAALERLLRVHRCAGVTGLQRLVSSCRDVPSVVRIEYDRETKEITSVR